MISIDAASDTCERHAPPRSWGGLGKFASLLPSTSIRRSIELLHSNTPSAELAAWECIVTHGIMQHPVRLERASWMRFEQRTYTIMPRQPSPPILGELSLTTPCIDGLPTFVHDSRPTTTSCTSTSPESMPSRFHLHRASFQSSPSVARPSQLSPTTAWSTCFHSTAFPQTPKSSLPMDTKLSDLEPGDLPGTSSYPLIQNPITALHDLSTTPPPTLHSTDVTPCATKSPWPTMGCPLPTRVYQRHPAPSS